MVIGHNSLGFTFGGFAQATWAGSGGATEAAGDFLFRLGPGATPVAYRPTGKDTDYQLRNPGVWPTWGSDGDDLLFGVSGALGQSVAWCHQGNTYAGHNRNTYAGEPNDACGGDGNWGATEMEVWYRVGS